MNVYVHIDRLILEGVPVDFAGRPALQAAVEAEIGRLFAERGVAPGLFAGGARAEAPAGAVSLPGGVGAEDWGREIGRAVHGGISR